MWLPSNLKIMREAPRKCVWFLTYKQSYNVSDMSAVTLGVLGRGPSCQDDITRRVLVLCPLSKSRQGYVAVGQLNNDKPEQRAIHLSSKVFCISVQQ